MRFFIASFYKKNMPQFSYTCPGITERTSE
jgi:hypothetical protein